MAEGLSIYEEAGDYLESYVTPRTGHDMRQDAAGEEGTNQYQGLRGRPNQSESYELPPIPDRNLKKNPAAGIKNDWQGRDGTQGATELGYGREDYLSIVPNNNIEEADIYDDVDTNRAGETRIDVANDKKKSGKTVSRDYMDGGRKEELPLKHVSGNDCTFKETHHRRTRRCKCLHMSLFMAILALVAAGASLLLVFLNPKECVCTQSSDLAKLTQQIRLLNSSLNLLSEKFSNSTGDSATSQSAETITTTTIAPTSNNVISTLQPVHKSTVTVTERYGVTPSFDPTVTILSTYSPSNHSTTVTP